MKAIVLNTMICILGRVHHHVLLRCVENMGYTKTLEVGDVAHSLTITNDDSRTHLVAIDRSPFLLFFYMPCCTSAVPHMVLIRLLIVAGGEGGVPLGLVYGGSFFV